ncbi:class I SAM-dependent DNA methyltransferase [Christiangramia sediminis]|uniref:Methyltransferase domain-containing protein n=1 Tax=Christiangramia sediminis TaxID=2881336 RepID=A0A9X1LJT5_9FLAO|nr:class I SAM-dependent methyltransferase [Christiangramia sediminis]MCB7481706.1 methyltransferase domain-containing protein [Christiangramia sediminis]
MSIEKAYDQWSSQYDHNKNLTRDLDKRITRDNLENLVFNSVLELGCGTGKNTEWLQTKASKILAVDFSEEMLGIAKKKINSENVIFQKADITQNWDWSIEKYNLITCNLILEHIEDLEFIFKQAFSKLNKDGYFFVSELHPFKQYKGTKARFDSEKDGLIELKTYTHHISEFFDAARSAGFQLKKFNEYFDEDNNELPRILSLLFQKV